MTTNFVSKVSRIKNNKEKNYYVYRINIPQNAIKQLNLKQNDHIFVQTKKAEWYHMLDWNTMSLTWDKLPPDIQRSIIQDGLIDKTDIQKSDRGEEKVTIKYAGTGHSTNSPAMGSG